MVRIRLRRVGAKKQPHYRVVVADQRSPRDGRHIETIGHYNPRTEPETISIQEDRALYWLSQGAQPSDVVLHMLEKQGTLDRLARFKAGEPLEALVAEYMSGADADEVIELAEQPAAAEASEAEASASEDEDQLVEAEVETEVPEAAEEESSSVNELDEVSSDED